MAFAGMNLFAILAAGIAGFVIGGVWYSLLSRPWLAAQDMTPESVRSRPKAGPAWLPFAIALVADLAMAWMMAGILGHLGPGQVTVRNGIISAGFIWFGFILTTTATNYAFQSRKPMLTVIDAGHWLVALVVMGAVIGAFGA